MRTLSLALALALLSPTAKAETSGLYVLAINGGGDKRDNFASHLEHLRQLLDLLKTVGVPKDHITVLASDGGNPAPDLATHADEPEDAWLLQGTRIDSWLRDLGNYENSTLDGIDLRPATLPSLTHAIADLRARLRKGDTLLLYVTDHGTMGPKDPLDNRITLWGERESISVRKLGELLSRLPQSVRVVSLMSQCFSGGFAYLHEARERSRTPSGRTCGYFSSTPDRPAYGCYPEVRGQKAIGHSFKFLSALARRGRFSAAHGEVMIEDDTPDIPLRSSDVYVAEQLANATPTSQNEADIVDPILRDGLARGKFAREAQLIDRIARVYAIDRPSSLADLDARANQLFDFLDQLDARAKIWESALSDFNQANLDAFLAARPGWKNRLGERALRALDASARADLAFELLDELAPFVGNDTGRMAEAKRLLAGLGDNDDIAYRTEIRVAALLRMRFVMTTAAGREWLRKNKSEEAAVSALEQCEDLALPVAQASPRIERIVDTPKFPPVADDHQRSLSARPGWLGLSFVPVSPGRRKRMGLPGGAAQITAVLPRSPAALAGMQDGDIVLGPPGHVLTHASELRPLIVSTSIGASLPFEILRGKNHLVVNPRVGEAPAPKPRN